jgi:GT2 family glycosyltransferase
MTGPAPDLSVIIVQYGAWDDLDRCLRSLHPVARSGTAPGTEVIVVDNAPGDPRLGEFRERFGWVTFVENTGNHGFAHGCNRGAQRARGAELLFFNPDAYDPGGQIAEAWRLKREHPEATILTVRQVDERGRAQKVFGVFPSALNLLGPARAMLRVVRLSRYVDSRRCGDAFRVVDWVSGSVFMIRRHAFEELGGWCEAFWMYSEDVDLCRRARAAGMTVAFSARATLGHRHGGTSRRDVETAAMARAAVVTSKHLYAARHLGAMHAALFHALLLASRFAPLVLARAVAVVWRKPPAGLEIRAREFDHLAAYYAKRLRGGGGRS